VPVSQAVDLLCASYLLYRYTGTKDTEAIFRTVSYGLPAALHAHVQTVAPTTYFASPSTPLQTPCKRSNEEAAAMMMMNATSGELMGMLSRRDHDKEVSFLRALAVQDANLCASAAMGQNVLGILGPGNEYLSQEDLTEVGTTPAEQLEPRR
jgi:hypothetical protein